MPSEPGQETGVAEALAELEIVDEVPVAETELVADPEAVLEFSVVVEPDTEDADDEELEVTSFAPHTPPLLTAAPRVDLR